MGWEPTDEEWLDHDKIYFERGSREELDRLVRLALLCEPWEQIVDGASDKRAVWIGAAFKKKAHVMTERVRYYDSQTVHALVDVFLKYHQPVGYVLGYDDESRYWKEEGYFDYQLSDVTSASARERMNARRELAQWLMQHGYDPERFRLAAIPVAGSTGSAAAPVASTTVPDLPLFAGLAPAQPVEPTVMHACGRWVQVPFAMLIQHGLTAEAQAEEAMMSYTDAYLDYSKEAFASLKAALGTPVEIQHDIRTMNYAAMAKYKADIATAPIEHGTVLLLSDDRKVLVVQAMGEMRLSGYRDRYWLRHIKGRVAPQDVPEWMKRGIKPTERANPDYIVVCAGREDGPDDALKAYLQRHNAEPVPPNETRASGVTWAYKFTTSMVGMRRFRSACSSGYKRGRNAEYQPAKFPSVSYWSTEQAPQAPAA